MPWTDRIREAVYTSPSGNSFKYQYEDVRRSVEKKTTAFDFPDAEGTYIQDLGHTGYRYPMRLIFWGSDHDIEATNFENALLETGIGKLEHPFYGTINVVPFGIITRRDDLKTAGNQTIIDMSFWDTIDLVYPTNQEDPASQVLTSVNDYNDVMADELEENTDLDTAFERVTFENTFTALLAGVETALQPIADTQDDIMKQFDNIYDSINSSIDILVGIPVTLALQTEQLIQAPARAITSIKAKLDGYFNVLQGVLSRLTPTSIANNDSLNKNEFFAKNIFASTAVTGSVISVVNNQFFKKSDAIESAEVILSQMDQLTDWRDENFEVIDEVDTGESYQKLQNSVALAAGFLVQISFTLKQERKITLDRDRTIIDVVGELYGTVDSELDFFINTNDLSGSEIIELKRGREIVYYV